MVGLPLEDEDGSRAAVVVVVVVAVDVWEEETALGLESL